MLHTNTFTLFFIRACISGVHCAANCIRVSLFGTRAGTLIWANFTLGTTNTTVKRPAVCQLPMQTFVFHAAVCFLVPKIPVLAYVNTAAVLPGAVGSLAALFGVLPVALARVRRLIVLAIARVGGALAPVFKSIAGACARIGRAHTRISRCIAGITFAAVRCRIRGIRASLAFLLVGVFLTRALIGTFTRVRCRVGGVRAVLAFLLIGVFFARALIGTFTRVRRRIAGAGAGIGRTHTRIGFGIAGACARIGRTFARISCCIVGITFAAVRRRIRGVRAVLAFLLVGVFIARALIGTFTRVRRRIAGARTAVGRAFAWIGSGIAGAHAAVGRAFTRIG